MANLLTLIATMTKRVLIIDDEEDIREVVQAALEEFAGWEVVSAASGKEGLQLLKSNRFDAIILDVSMPLMDGITVLEQIQQENADIPVVFLTARVLPSDRKRFAAMKVAGVISKPFNPVTIWQDLIKILHW